MGKSVTVDEVRKLLEEGGIKVSGLYFLPQSDSLRDNYGELCFINSKGNSGTFKERCARRKEMRDILVKAGVDCLNVGKTAIRVDVPPKG